VCVKWERERDTFQVEFIVITSSEKVQKCSKYCTYSL
jgi:hypothetical protein